MRKSKLFLRGFALLSVALWIATTNEKLIAFLAKDPPAVPVGLREKQKSISSRIRNTERGTPAKARRSSTGRSKFRELFAKFNSSAPIHSENWIIVTTVNPPTRQMLEVCSIPDWNKLVVGDSSTPDSEWQKVEGCAYLSLADQLELDYHVGNLIPIKRYERKIIGYLFIIEAGGEIVFDTDDDNIQAAGVPLVLPHQDDSWLCCKTASDDETAWNAYAHFGKEDIWNRGLPLDRTMSKIEYVTEAEGLTRVRPLIQQGLVNMDPDLDAIARLTKPFSEISNVRFSDDASVLAFPRWSYHPINSQNTVYTRDAMWALLLPTTTLWREDDIFRGYWNQRLLWEIGGSLIIQGATAYQVRNPHDFLLDLSQETDMYRNTAAMLKVLNEWRCPSHLTLGECVVDIHEMLHSEGYLKGKEDVVIAKAWNQDLLSLEYRFPSRVDITSSNKGEHPYYASCSLVNETYATLPRQYVELRNTYKSTSGLFLANASREELEALFDPVECGQGDTRGCEATRG